MHILAIETSCDETAVAIVDDKKQILFEKLHSQDHSMYGGVVPELASRNHLTLLQDMVSDAINAVPFTHVAVTCGPGLIGGVIVGVMMAKAIASATKKRFLAINHLEGHILSPRLQYNIDFPFLILLISGGHCQFVIAESVGKYKVIGKSLDDALGETFDKTAKMLGLKYPGGPEVEMFAKKGDEHRFDFVKPMYRRIGCDFSFSGLKTAIKRVVDKISPLDEQDKCDVCASFQRVVCEILIDRMSNAIEIFHHSYSGNNCVIVGGVAANAYIQSSMVKYIKDNNMILSIPSKWLCTDNAVMIAWAAIERLEINQGSGDSLNFAPKAKWPLDYLDMQIQTIF